MLLLYGAHDDDHAHGPGAGGHAGPKASAFASDPGRAEAVPDYQLILANRNRAKRDVHIPHPRCGRGKRKDQMIFGLPADPTGR